MADTDDFERHYQSLGLPPSPGPDSIAATWGQLSSGPTIASGSQPAAQESRASSTLPQLEIATPSAAQGLGANAELTTLEILGEGGMGQVLLARQWSLEREVAVKILKSAATDEAARALVDEARIAGGLEHPGVVPIYALARDARGHPAVVMKRVEGTSWADLLKNPDHPAWSRVAPAGKDRLEANVGILVQVCNALAFAHRRGVLHRDLKPANVLLGELGEIYLADWGVAARKGQTGPDRLVGTPAYMAPEMVRGKLESIDERTDVYLAGATLHEIVTGRPPHLGEDLRAVLHRAWDSAAPTFTAQAPGELAALCLRALSRRPEDRPADVLAFRDALLGFLQHQGSVRLTQSAAERLARLEEAFRSAGSDPAKKGYALLAECRFAFSQALLEWPQNAAAREGLTRAVSLAVRHELANGNSGAARALLSELADPPEALVREVEAHAALDAASRRRTDELERLAHESDPQVSARERNRLLLGMAGAILAFIIAVRVFGLREVFEAHLGVWFKMVPMAWFVLVLAVGVTVGRRSLLATRLNRQLLTMMLTGSCAVMAVRVTTTLSDVPTNVAFSIDGLVMATVMATAAIFTHWSFIAPGVVFVIGSAVSLVFPDLAVVSFSLTGVSAFLIAVLAWRFWLNDQSATAPKGPR